MLGYIVFTLLVAGALAQSPCECGVFVTAEIGELMLYQLPAFDLSDCNNENECAKLCNNEFDTFTNGGDLTSTSWDGINSVGQFLCNNAAGNVIDSKLVFAYYRLCDTNWQWTGDTATQPLCCDASGIYNECPAI